MPGLLSSRRSRRSDRCAGRTAVPGRLGRGYRHLCGHSNHNVIVDAAAFVAFIKCRHPELVEEINLLDDQPNATLSAGVLARRTREAIDAGDRDAVRGYFETALRAWDDGDDRVQNSIGLSFLAKLNFRDGRRQRAWAWALLHPRLADAATSVGNSPVAST